MAAQLNGTTLKCGNVDAQWKDVLDGADKLCDHRLVSRNTPISPALEERLVSHK
jgi:hypothetical protein